jgi:hypothetical protein
VKDGGVLYSGEGWGTSQWRLVIEALCTRFILWHDGWKPEYHYTAFTSVAARYWSSLYTFYIVIRRMKAGIALHYFYISGGSLLNSVRRTLKGKFKFTIMALTKVSARCCWKSALNEVLPLWCGRSSSPGRVKNFLFSTSSILVLGPTQPLIQWVPAVKRPGRESVHSPPTSTDVKKTWIYTSTPPTSSWHSA